MWDFFITAVGDGDTSDSYAMLSKVREKIIIQYISNIHFREKV